MNSYICKVSNSHKKKKTKNKNKEGTLSAKNSLMGSYAVVF